MERAAFLIEESGRRIDCLLNPETIVFKREAGLKRRSVIGQLIGDAPWSGDMLLSGGGGLVQLQLDLLFDTSLQSSPPVDDVQLLTAPFWELAEHAVNSQGHYAPNLSRFIWGKTWNVLGMVSAVAERFEHFLPGGAPQRSWMRLNFVRVADPAARRRQSMPVNMIDADGVAPFVSPAVDFPEPQRNDFGRQPNAPMGEPGRLDQAAYALTGDPADWRRLAVESGIDDPTMLQSVAVRQTDTDRPAPEA